MQLSIKRFTAILISLLLASCATQPSDRQIARERKVPPNDEGENWQWLAGLPLIAALAVATAPITIPWQIFVVNPQEKRYLHTSQTVIAVKIIPRGKNPTLEYNKAREYLSSSAFTTDLSIAATQMRNNALTSLKATSETSVFQLILSARSAADLHKLVLALKPVLDSYGEKIEAKFVVINTKV